MIVAATGKHMGALRAGIQCTDIIRVSSFAMGAMISMSYDLFLDNWKSVSKYLEAPAAPKNFFSG